MKDFYRINSWRIVPVGRRPDGGIRNRKIILPYSNKTFVLYLSLVAARSPHPLLLRMQRR